MNNHFVKSIIFIGNTLANKHDSELTSNALIYLEPKNFSFIYVWYLEAQLLKITARTVPLYIYGNRNIVIIYW